MKPVFAMLLIVFVLSACSSGAPVPTLTPLPTNTRPPTETAVPSSTPTSTPEPAGTIADVDVTKFGYNLDPQKPEIVGATNKDGVQVLLKVGGNPDNPADVVATCDEKKVCWFTYGGDFKKHVLTMAKPQELVGGNTAYSPEIQKHILDIQANFSPTMWGYTQIILRKSDGTVDKYALAWFVPVEIYPRGFKGPKKGYLWFEYPGNTGADLSGLFSVPVDNYTKGDSK